MTFHVATLKKTHITNCVILSSLSPKTWVNLYRGNLHFSHSGQIILMVLHSDGRSPPVVSWLPANATAVVIALVLQVGSHRGEILNCLQKSNNEKGSAIEGA